MARTPTKPLTSEERCRKAFEQEIVPALIGYDENQPTDLAWWMGWKFCWRYLEEQVQKEFIER